MGKNTIKPEAAVTAATANNVSNLVERVSQANKILVDAISPSDNTPFEIDAEERGQILSALEKVIIEAESAKEVLRGGSADAHRRELAEIGDRVRNDLSGREIQVLPMVAMGFANKEIGDALGVTQSCIDAHRANISRKIHAIIGHQPTTMDVCRCAHLAGTLTHDEWMAGLK